MDAALEKLDAIPLASVLTVVMVAGGLFAFVTGQISYEEFLLGTGAATTGNAALGHVRNKAGKGR